MEASATARFGRLVGSAVKNENRQRDESKLVLESFVGPTSSAIVLVDCTSCAMSGAWFIRSTTLGSREKFWLLSLTTCACGAERDLIVAPSAYSARQRRRRVALRVCRVRGRCLALGTKTGSVIGLSFCFGDDRCYHDRFWPELLLARRGRVE